MSARRFPGIKGRIQPCEKSIIKPPEPQIVRANLHLFCNNGIISQPININQKELRNLFDLVCEASKYEKPPPVLMIRINEIMHNLSAPLYNLACEMMQQFGL